MQTPARFPAILLLCTLLILLGCKKDKDEVEYTYTIVPLTILSYGTPQSAVLEQSFVRQFPAMGGRPPYVWTLESGSLPPGLTLQSNGRITGVPTATGEYTYTLKLTDSKGSYATTTYTQRIGSGGTNNFVLGTLQIPEFGQDQDVGYLFFAQGGALPWTFTITGLPDGVTYDPATGLISGKPTTPYTGTISVMLTDANGQQAAGSPVTASFQVNAPQPVNNGGGGGGGVGCPSVYDGTYMGQFKYTYYVKGQDGNYNPVLGSLQLTLKLNCLATAAGSTVLQVTHAVCSDPNFGCQLGGCAPNFGSVATLPADPPANPSNPSLSGQGIVILFPNGSTIMTTNQPGALNVSSDGRTLSNSLDPQFAGNTWVAVGGDFPSGATPGGPVVKFDSWVMTWSNTE